MRIILFASGGGEGGEGGGLPSQPPSCFKAIHAAIKKHYVITMFTVRQGYADHFVCKWGGAGCAPPNPADVLKPSMLPLKKSIMSSPCLQ